MPGGLENRLIAIIRGVYCMVGLKISVLNVGHGDFIYATTPLGNKLVIDCGNDGGDVNPAKFLSPISTIDELQISHPHTDHFGDIIALSEKNIRSFRCPPLENFTDDVIGWKNNDAKKIAKLRQLKRSINPLDEAVLGNTSFQHYVFCPDNIDYTNANTASRLIILNERI
jgi:competence protein ComEC